MLIEGRVELPQGITIMGSGLEQEVRGTFPEMSLYIRHQADCIDEMHTRITVDGNRAYLRDLKSRSKTKLSPKDTSQFYPVRASESWPLRSGDTIQVAVYSVHYLLKKGRHYLVNQVPPPIPLEEQ